MISKSDKWDGEEHLPPEARRNLRKMAAAADPAEGLNQAKAQLGVVFVDERGTVFSFQNSHLYRCYPEGDDLVAEFTGHRVILSGRGLFAPVHNSLLMLLTLHKRDLVSAIPGGEARDFGQEKFCVTGVKVVEVKR